MRGSISPAAKNQLGFCRSYATSNRPTLQKPCKTSKPNSRIHASNEPPLTRNARDDSAPPLPPPLRTPSHGCTHCCSQICAIGCAADSHRRLPATRLDPLSLDARRSSRKPPLSTQTRDVCSNPEPHCACGSQASSPKSVSMALPSPTKHTVAPCTCFFGLHSRRAYDCCISVVSPQQTRRLHRFWRLILAKHTVATL